MIQRSLLLLLAGATLLLINLVFTWATFPDLAAEESTATTTAWALPDLQRAPPPAIADLLADGFWGKVDPQRLAGETGDAETMETIDEREARQLRRRVKAII